MEVKEAMAASGTREQSKYEVRFAVGGTKYEFKYERRSTKDGNKFWIWELRFMILKELVGKLNFFDFSVGVLRTDFFVEFFRQVSRKSIGKKNVGFYSHT